MKEKAAEMKFFIKRTLVLTTTAGVLFLLTINFEITSRMRKKEETLGDWSFAGLTAEDAKTIK